MQDILFSKTDEKAHLLYCIVWDTYVQRTTSAVSVSESNWYTSILCRLHTFGGVATGGEGEIGRDASPTFPNDQFISFGFRPNPIRSRWDYPGRYHSVPFTEKCIKTLEINLDFSGT